MVNRRAFFEIFFYNRENRSREMMEAAEGVWRAYMKKYGLGLDAGTDGQPTYDEVREITYLANAAIEAVEKQMAEAAAEEEKRKKLQKEAWDLGIFVPVDTATSELEKLVLKAMNPEPEMPEEEPVEETPEEAEEVPEEPVEEAAEAVAEEAEEEPDEEPVEETPEAVIAEPAPVVRVERKFAEPKVVERIVQVPAEPVCSAAGSDMDLWVQQLTRWCKSKGMQCITTDDDGDCYIHVYLPYKKDVHTVGAWCFKKDAGFAEQAAEISRLYAYCEGFIDCFAKLIK